jgi:hypothetical protein
MDYRVLKKQERWVETIIHDVESPIQALELSENDDDWTEWSTEYTGEYEVYDWNTHEIVLNGNEFKEVK